jgi:hypothetical protein
MRSQFWFEFSLFLFLCVGRVMAQQASSEDKSKFVIVPREVGLVTIAYQPDCPLQFEKVSFWLG